MLPAIMYVPVCVIACVHATTMYILLVHMYVHIIIAILSVPVVHAYICVHAAIIYHPAAKVD